MNSAKISWYSIGLNGKVEEHEPIDLEGAAGIIDRYLIYAGQKYKSDKEAIAATMFGFSKSKSDFVEICVYGPNQFSYRFEFSENTSGSRKFFGNVVLREEELHSRDELVKHVAEFFNDSGQKIAGQIGGTKKRAKSPLRIPARASIGARVFTIIFIMIVGLSGLCLTVEGLFLGKIWVGQTHGAWIFRDRNPVAFWIFATVYMAISIWLIRGCVLETRIVQKMFSDRKNIK